MCGIAGILHYGTMPAASARIRRMADAIVHRGPDDEGFRISDDVALGFRRLAIVDIATGAQPMSNADDTVTVVFNGEIYNHRALRSELEARGHVFRTDHSDTEVLVHGWREWGTALPGRLNGMFAFAIWDANARSLFLARDRYGIKPLYMARLDGAVVFGSEARALFASGLVEKTEDASSIAHYFGLMNFWHGRTPFRGVELMAPATWRLFTPTGERAEQYWQWSYNRSRREALPQAAGEFRAHLLDAVKRQVDADVPVMTYLSGGIDSSSVTAAAHALDPKMRAYSCIFNLDKVGADAFVDEREFSRSVAAHLGIDRVELELPQDIMVRQIEHTIAALEYPRMGMAYVNDLIAGRVAQDAKVVLSGMGGDEVTGGYVGRYGLVPRPAAPGTDAFEIYRACLNVPIQDVERQGAFTPDFLRAVGDYVPLDDIREAIAKAPTEDPWDVLMHVDATTYLHGLLVLEDKLSMIHSLETRVPLLDNVLVDYLLETPWELLCDGSTGKILFREAVRPLVPEDIYRKPKMGFGPPDASWYRGALRPYVESILSPERIARRGVFRYEWVRAKLDAHMSGQANWVALIWCLISFEIWCDQNGVFGGRTPSV